MMGRPAQRDGDRFSQQTPITVQTDIDRPGRPTEPGMPTDMAAPAGRDPVSGCGRRTAYCRIAVLPVSVFVVISVLSVIWLAAITASGAGAVVPESPTVAAPYDRACLGSAGSHDRTSVSPPVGRKTRRQAPGRASAVWNMSGQSTGAVASAPGIGIRSAHGARNGDAPSAGTGTAACAVWDWPVRQADGTIVRTIVRQADIPEKNWQKGHRGIDLPAGDGAGLVCLADGRIIFAGRVGGKDVVTIRTDDGFRASFEPAVTTLAKDTPVRRGQAIGTVEGSSDHCGSRCVHLGVRKDGRYIDPSLLLLGETIRLKPVGGPA